MTYQFSTNFNTVQPQVQKNALIPSGTLAKATFMIRKGGFGVGDFLTQSAHTGAIYVNAEFTIIEGPYARRKIFQRIGIQGSKPDDVWGNQGKAMLRSIVESARNVPTNDMSEAAQHLRNLPNLGDMNGMTCVVRIGVEADKTGQYEPQNKIIAVLTPDQKSYRDVMSQPAATQQWV